ncbi:hypothetical protein CR970_03670 [Candidatus Saccharibacteria bacterium]|nr:MAG: hypothetical protein CR970_03670 [Candidatus Saccharibacteria bacterium]
MGDLWLIAAAGLVLCFGFVVLFGAPYLPTLTPQVRVALDLLDLKPGQHMLELGSGDGKVMLAAVERGWRVTGYELNPILVLVSRWRLRQHRDQATVVWGNFWRHTWTDADGIFSFNLQRQMLKLDTKIMKDCPKRPVRLASFAFTINGRKPVGQREGVFLYCYNTKNDR